MKKKGFGAGRWNGFGGKVENGETIEAAAKRELEEESGLRAVDLEKIGVMDFEFTNKPDEVLETHLFKVKNFDGELRESDEMRPQWFNLYEIPFREMWADDIHWFPYFIDNKKFQAKFLFDENDKVLQKEIIEVGCFK